MVQSDFLIPLRDYVLVSDLIAEFVVFHGCQQTRALVRPSLTLI